MNLLRGILLFLGIIFAISTVSIIILAANNATTDLIVRIVNTPPVINNVTVTPNPADPGNTITVNATITDANGIPGDVSTVKVTYIGPGGETFTFFLVFNESISPTVGKYSNNTFTLPSNATPGTWFANVTVNDTKNAQTSFLANFTVNAFISITLANTPVDFGNASSGETLRRAENGTTNSVQGFAGGPIKGFPLLINNNGNVNLAYNMTGNNLTGQTNSSFVIPVSNIFFNTIINTSSAQSLSETVSKQLSNGNVPNSAEESFFWITLPTTLTEQEYKGNVTILATQG